MRPLGERWCHRGWVVDLDGVLIDSEAVWDEIRGGDGAAAQIVAAFERAGESSAST